MLWYIFFVLLIVNAMIQFNTSQRILDPFTTVNSPSHYDGPLMNNHYQTLQPYPKIQVLKGEKGAGAIAIHDFQLSWGIANNDKHILVKQREWDGDPAGCIVTPASGDSQGSNPAYSNLTSDSVSINAKKDESPTAFMVFGKCKSS